MEELIPNSSFNSILVRLKASVENFKSSLNAAFQFHTGSIKSRHLISDFLGTQKFQFHTGSIKSRKEFINKRLNFFGFNSILVRLKGDKHAWCDRLYPVSIPYWFD